SALTLRCPGVRGDLLPPGPHTLTIGTTLASGASLTRSVTWVVDTADLLQPGVVVSPPSGTLVSTQVFDLDFIINPAGHAVVGGRVTLDGADVTGVVAACVRFEPLPSGALSARCPGLAAGVFGVGTHTLSVRLDFDNGTSASDGVTWQIRANTE